MRSTVTGELLTGEELTPDYWFESLRRPVEFEAATRALIAEGHGALIEVSARTRCSPSR